MSKSQSSIPITVITGFLGSGKTTLLSALLKKNDVNRHGENIQAFAMTADRPVNMIVFSLFLDLLAAQVGADLLRVKGIINIAGENRPAVIHGVQHIFHPVKWLDAWPDEDVRTRLVFITRNMQKEQVEVFFSH